MGKVCSRVGGRGRSEFQSGATVVKTVPGTFDCVMFLSMRLNSPNNSLHISV